MKYLVIFALCMSAVAQTSISGQTSITGQTGTEPIRPTSVAGNFFAALPINWVDSHMCDPPGGIYTENDVTLGTISVAGLTTLLNNWAGGWYRIKVPAGSLLNSSTYNGDNALISLPIRTATGCMVIESTTPAQSNRILCSHGLPGYGGTRNPGCTNDIAKLWTIQQDDNPGHTNFSAIYCGPGCNHILIRDIEATILKGSDQSNINSKGRRPISYEGADHVGLERYYIHGYDPGDSGQPAGVCAAWNRAGTVNTSGTTVTYASGDRFGMDFSDATHSTGWTQVIAGNANHLVINGVNYTITNHDPTVSDTVLTVSPSAGTQTGAAFTLTNAATAFSVGCGDDVFNGLDFNCDYCWREWGYIEKIHTWGLESHSSVQGFSAGPIKVNHNWEEAGGGGYFSGGSPVDTRASGTGPVFDVEARGNYFGRNLAYRNLSATSGHSPAMPFGCGPTFDHVAAHHTCAFNWDIKNTVEIKLAERALFDGNIIENNWSDGQDGTNPVIGVRVCGGGATCGVFDSVTGLPRTVVANLRFSNNWVRNSAQGPGLSTRSGGPGNGGGISKAIQNVDIINNVLSNLGDDNQFGTPGSDLWTWGGISNTFTCTMTRGQEFPNVAHAHCSVGTFIAPDGSHTNVSSVIRASGIVTMKFGGDRHDPVINKSVTITGASGWNGAFNIDGALNGASTALWCSGGTNNRASCTVNSDCSSNSCVASNGTYGDAIVYSDGGSPANLTLCTSNTACNSAGIVATVPTWAFSITDINIGDAVHVVGSDCSGGANPTSYAASVSGVTYAIAPTAANSLDVYYVSIGANDAGGTTCLLDNGSGFPKNTQFANNTVLLPGLLSINSKGSGTVWQHITNLFVHNIFAQSGSPAVLTCNTFSGEGTAVFPCWDLTTFSFYDNVLQGRTSSSWSIVPVAAAANTFPLTVTCSGATATPTCLGFSGFMSGVTFPTTPCPTANAPYNCPLMATPWSSNFDLSKLVPVGTSIYSTEGADLNALQDAFTRTQYVCPVGSNCGTTGPFPD